MNTNLYPSADNYNKALARLQISLQSGRFAKYTQQKKRQIWNRLCRYARQLGIKIKASVVAACVAAGLSFITPAVAQTFTQQTGASNPFNGVNVGDNSGPAFVDIDGDGDMDAFISTNDYEAVPINYFKNTGTTLSPVFSAQSGASNPFNGESDDNYSAPAFVDVDGDGDIDVFIGEDDGTIRYFKNTGTALAPVFTEQTGAANPFNGVDVGSYSGLAFVDIDGDGDMDAFIGGGAYFGGTIHYYKNAGTTAAAVFVEQTGAADPFNGVDFGDFSGGTFVDIDKDGDMDAIIGAYDGTISYYKNTGTAVIPVFTVQTGAANPFDGIDVGDYSLPAFVDVDGDGDMDVFIGAYDGTITYYQNTSVLPLQLISFSGNRQAGRNQLQWQTASEMNTKIFELEMSSDGRNFIKIADMNAAGSGSNNYKIIDNAVYNGKVFYRIKMIDADGRFTYSQIIWIKSGEAGGITIYPNPVTDMLNLNIGDTRILKTNARIYDARGRLLQNVLVKSNQQQINVQPLAKGVYLIKFANGTTQSFIKK